MLGHNSVPRGSSSEARRPDSVRSAANGRGIAGQLGSVLELAAWAIHDAVNSNVANAIHVVTVQRGLDPSENTLVAGGAPAPVHMAGVAARFGIPTLVVLFEAGSAQALSR